MKELEFETSQGKFILLEAPSKRDDQTEPYVTHIDAQRNTVSIQNIDTGSYTWVYEVNGPIEAVGFIRELTEEQFAEIVDKAGAAHFKRYHRPGGMIIASIGAHVIKSASESFRTLVESHHHYLFDNPYENPGLMPSAELELYRRINNRVFKNPFLIKLI
mgnify:CR=1 FL=1